MTSFSLFALVRQILGSLCQILLKPVRRWIKPDNHAPIPNAALDLMRSKSELMLENALLRQQVIVLQRQTKRPKLTWRDRTVMVLLASKLRAWKQALIIVQPDTLLRWHREIVCTQMTKAALRSGFASRYDITDFHLIIVDDDAVDEEFDQLSALGKSGQCQALLDALAEGLNRSRDGRHFDSFLDLGIQLAQLR